MIALTIDGDHSTGRYHVACRCGDRWGGDGDRLNRGSFSPAPALADCVMHVKVMHPDEIMSIEFTPKFMAWLMEYVMFQAKSTVKEIQDRLLTRRVS